jgi:glutamate synthase domain-containing protein 2
LAQLIFDLKQVNPQALVSVKLVAKPAWAPSPPVWPRPMPT